jgi:hypothetical protein
VEEAMKLIEQDDASQLQEKRQRRQKVSDENKARIQSVEKNDPVSKRRKEEDDQTLLEGNDTEFNGRRRRPRPPSPIKGRRENVFENVDQIDDADPISKIKESPKRQPPLDEVLSSKGISWRNGGTAADDNEPTKRKPRGDRKRSVNLDGSPKRVYNGRDPYNGAFQRAIDDRGDPPAPDSRLWVDIDTFKNLLRREAKFRMTVLGDDWAPRIKAESDWRLQLYKGWLWALHNGVGSSIVPPSRYERARNMRRRRGMPDPDEVADDKTANTQTTTQRRQRRKEKSKGPPSRK